MKIDAAMLKADIEQMTVTEAGLFIKVLTGLMTPPSTFADRFIDGKYLVNLAVSGKIMAVMQKYLNESHRFVPPSVDEVKEYCLVRNNSIDAQYFCDFYQSKGWMVGKTKMKDWRASVRTWERTKKQEQTQTAKPKRQIFT